MLARELQRPATGPQDQEVTHEGRSLGAEAGGHDPGVETTVRSPGVETTVRSPEVETTVRSPGVETTVRSPGVETRVQESGFGFQCAFKKYVLMRNYSLPTYRPRLES